VAISDVDTPIGIRFDVRISILRRIESRSRAKIHGAGESSHSTVVFKVQYRTHVHVIFDFGQITTDAGAAGPGPVRGRAGPKTVTIPTEPETRTRVQVRIR
jgi:hypothetical protein